MSETIYNEKDGGTLPGGTPPGRVAENLAEATEALEHEKQLDPDKSYGQVEHDIVGPAGNPSRMDQGRSTDRTKGKQKA